MTIQDDLRSADKELAGSEEKERQLNMKIKTLSGKLRAEQDEVSQGTQDVLLACPSPHIYSLRVR